MSCYLSASEILANVKQALTEDIGSGDISASLIEHDHPINATIISRQAAVLCGQAWANEVFKQLDPAITLQWYFKDGDQIQNNDRLCSISGPAKMVLSGERSALNFLQLLSATATKTKTYVDAIRGTDCAILDTRKTIPGLRGAQKYAVTCGGGKNHRVGLFDAYLIKENHIEAIGSIRRAIVTARAQQPDKLLEIEVETIAQFEEALAAKPDRILLDNFSLVDLKIAVNKNNGQVKLEASGGITLETIKAIADTGVDFISVGAITKDIQAVDLSLLVETKPQH